MLPGVGWTELIVLCAIAIIVVGPRDLPRLMRSIGQWVGKARAMAREFQSSFEEMARESEMEELRKEASKLREAARLPRLDEPVRPLSPGAAKTLAEETNRRVLAAESAPPPAIELDPAELEEPVSETDSRPPAQAPGATVVGVAP